MIELARIDDRLEELHPTFAAWWKGHGFPVLPLAALQTLGLMASDDGKPVAACWIYTASTGGFAMLEWMVSDPEASPLLTAKAIHKLVEFAKQECTVRKYGVLFTTCRQASLGRVYLKNGFTKTDENVTHYLSVLEA